MGAKEHARSVSKAQVTSSLLDRSGLGLTRKIGLKRVMMDSFADWKGIAATKDLP